MMIRWFSFAIWGLLVLVSGCTLPPDSSRLSTPIVTVEHPKIDVGATTTLPVAPTISVIQPSDKGKLRRVVYAKGGMIWLWGVADSPKPLTVSMGNAPAVRDHSPKISDDGLVVAFVRDGNLWAMNADGTNQRMLAPLQSSQLKQFDFAPHSYDIYFNTATNLAKVNADSVALRALLNNSQGGESFVISPNGAKIALLRSNKVDVVNADGSGLKTVFNFQPIKINDQSMYIPEIVWLPDGSGFKTVLPAPDSLNARFMFISADGTIIAKLAEFNISPVSANRPFIAPDGSRVLYTKTHGSDLELHMIDAGTADKTVGLLHADRTFRFLGWAPDSGHFLYGINGSAWLGSEQGLTDLLNIPDTTHIAWVDAQSFLFVDHALMLRFLKLGQSDTALDDGLDDDIFDFFAAP